MEIILAVALFAIFALMFISTISLAHESSIVAKHRITAEHLAQEGVEAVRAIRDRAVNEFTYSQSAVTSSTGAWTLSGEGTSETIGEFTRTITFTDVCRDGTDVIVTCPAGTVDMSSHMATIAVTRTTIAGRSLAVNRSVLLTNWQSDNWTQTDWSSGDGQAIWADTAAYDSDSGDVDVTTGGQLQLNRLNEQCGTKSWSFTASTSYSFDSDDIEITGGEAVLIPAGPGDTNYPNDEPAIAPLVDFIVTGDVDEWTQFSETATKNAGEIYYQISSDNGSNWEYWTGAAWGAAGGADYNTAADINTNIGSFTTSSGRISFQAFLSSDGTHDVLLDEISIRCGNQYQWPFSASTSYTFNAADIEVTGGQAQLVSAGGGGSDINGAVTETFEFDTSNTTMPYVLSLGNDIFAIAYTGSGNDGFIKTVSVDAAGDIGGAVIDTYEFDTKQGKEVEIIHVSGDNYLITYSGDKNDGYAVTVDIDAAGNIGAVIDSTEFDNKSGRFSSLIELANGVFAVVYEGNKSDGFIQTFSVNGAGAITEVDSYEYDTASGKYPSITAISGDIYAIAYQGAGSDGWLVTVDIDTSGNITNSIIDSLEFDTSSANTPNLIPISGDIYAISYEGAGNDGTITTVEIDAAGDITNAIVDSWEFETSGAYEMKLYPFDGTTYALVYEDATNNGILALLTIEDNGTLPAAFIDSEEFDATQGIDPMAYILSNSMIAIVYSGTGNDGYVTTIGVSAGAASYPDTVPTITPSSFLAVSGLGNYVGFTEVATKNTGEIYYQVSDNNGTSWYYWTGAAWAAAGASDYSIATDIHDNFSSFPTSSGQFLFRANLESDGTVQVQLDSVSIEWGNGEQVAGGYEVSGTLTSSAFDMGKNAAVQMISWNESIPSCAPACDIEIELRTADDSGGSPGVWSAWYGSGGAATTFSDNALQLLDTDLNQSQWLQYRATLSSDGDHTPVLQDVTINYQ